MKQSSPYLRLCQLAFLLACCVGNSFALSYIGLVHSSNWLAWTPGIGIALLFGATVMCFVGYGLSVQRGSISPRHFQFCMVAFIVACCFGINLAMTYLHLVHRNDWATWRPGIGIAVIFTSLVMSYIGCALGAQSHRRDLLPSA